MGDLLLCLWDGEVFRPQTPFQLRLARERFGEGEVVTLAIEKERTTSTHNHQFAAISDLWRTLPESHANQAYARSPDTLRKHALVATGFTNCEQIVCGSKAAAERVGAYVGQLATAAHGYAITQIEGATVRVWTPHSQSRAAMGAKEFQRSKQAILDWIEDLIAGRHAA